MDFFKPVCVELSARERGFVWRILRKYPAGQHRDTDLVRSLAIFCAMIAAGHLIERLVPAAYAAWLPLVIILPPALFMFSRYRRFSIFRSCVLSKVAGRLAQHEDIAPTPGAGVGHPHARRHAGSAPRKHPEQTPVPEIA